MLQTKRGQAAALIAAAFALSACADSPTGPTMTSAVNMPTSVNRAEVVGDACQTISFDGAGLVHGTAITNNLSLFGNPLTFTGQVSDAAGNLSANTLRIYAGGAHQGGPDFDLQSTGAGALCGACTSNMLVINDPVDGTAALPSDAQWGGRITITGFPANAYISSYQLADHEVAAPPIGEPDSRLIVDGVNIAPAGQPQGQNTIITINTTQVRLITGAGVTFILGNAPTQQGSEAIDNIRVCIREDLGDEGCTPGYWKNHEDSWGPTGFTTGQTLESVFNVPDVYGVDNVTLLAALSFNGGPTATDAAKLLLHHAVAAILNAAHPNVDYPQSAASIITAVNAALATGDRNTMLALKSTLDAQNNAGCPLN